MDQVCALEAEMLQRIKEQGLDIIPRILIVGLSFMLQCFLLYLSVFVGYSYNVLLYIPLTGVTGNPSATRCSGDLLWGAA